MLASPRYGATKVGFTTTIHAAGSSGIAATIWVAAFPTRMRARSNAGRQSAGTSCKLKRNCERGDLLCRPRQRQALLHWAYDSRKIDNVVLERRSGGVCARPRPRRRARAGHRSASLDEAGVGARVPFGRARPRRDRHSEIGWRGRIAAASTFDGADRRAGAWSMYGQTEVTRDLDGGARGRRAWRRYLRGRRRPSDRTGFDGNRPAVRYRQNGEAEYELRVRVRRRAATALHGVCRSRACRSRALLTAYERELSVRLARRRSPTRRRCRTSSSTPIARPRLRALQHALAIIEQPRPPCNARSTTASRHWPDERFWAELASPARPSVPAESLQPPARRSRRASRRLRSFVAEPMRFGRLFSRGRRRAHRAADRRQGAQPCGTPTCGTCSRALDRALSRIVQLRRGSTPYSERALQARVEGGAVLVSISPVPFDRAPYFAALVASSCSAMEIISAVRGATRISGPDRCRRGRLPAA